MELIQKRFLKRVKDFYSIISEDNLFLLSSSISFYSAVAIAPFLLILLGVAAVLGGDVQLRVIAFSSSFSPELGQMVELIFQNVNKGVDLGSISGLVGLFVLFFTASLVFLQLRFALDVIYGHHETKGNASIWEQIVEKIFAMFVVFMAGLFIIVSSSVPGIVKVLFPGYDLIITALLLNLVVYVAMFYGIHMYTPSDRPKKRDAFKMSLLSSVFFIIGNTILGFYFKTFATSSIYGAAGTLLVFLIWTYYSSFTMFLSVELMLFLRKIRPY